VSKMYVLFRCTSQNKVLLSKIFALFFCYLIKFLGIIVVSHQLIFMLLEKCMLFFSQNIVQGLF
jgi:hypothetical protein